MIKTNYEYFEAYEDTVDRYFEKLYYSEEDDWYDPYEELGLDPYPEDLTRDC